MAIEKLPVDFVDAVTSQQMYKVTNAGAGQVLIEDVSTYSVDGSYFGSKEINEQHSAINDLINSIENTNTVLNKIMNGTTVLNEAVTADTAQFAETAGSANYATSATTATMVTSVNTANTAGVASYAPQISGAKINNITFTGTSDITISDESKLANNDSFVLCSKASLTFSNKICEISDERITSDSLANVIYTTSCYENAKKACISVETMTGKVRLTAGRNPLDTLTATIYIRVV